VVFGGEDEREKMGDCSKIIFIYFISCTNTERKEGQL